ncbi:MAG: RNA 2'-phosphotransferase [Armatimonadota bacterium]
MDQRRRVRLSKRMSYFLRHHPEDGGLTPDARGFVPLAGLVGAVGADEEMVREVVACDAQGRFEIAGDRIRATYGHSIEVNQVGQAVEPPDVLYHGTPRRRVKDILRDGLRPMGRQMVHLSETVAQARRVGRRRDPKPAILRIDARRAAEAGVQFRRAGSVYVARQVPPEFIRRQANG